MNLWKLGVFDDNLFCRNWDSTFVPVFNQKTAGYIVKKDENSFKTKIVVPGVNKEDLDLTVENNKLTVKLEKDGEFVSAFTHIIELQEYNEESIKTSLVNGVLEITLEKKAELKPKKLKI